MVLTHTISLITTNSTCERRKTDTQGPSKGCKAQFPVQGNHNNFRHIFQPMYVGALLHKYMHNKLKGIITNYPTRIATHHQEARYEARESEGERESGHVLRVMRHGLSSSAFPR